MEKNASVRATLGSRMHHYHTKEGREALVSLFSILSAAISFLGLSVIIVSQMYVRWAINQDFSFLGGNALEALIVSVFGLILGIAYIHRPSN